MRVCANCVTRSGSRVQPPNSRTTGDRRGHEHLDRLLAGRSGEDARLLDRALEEKHVVMRAIVLAELLSDPKLPEDVADTLADPPWMPVEGGFWNGAGLLRARVLAKRRKARLADALIAQLCLDHQTPLLARDRDFRAFADVADLTLVPR